jgi:hypothetical protein
VQAKGQTTNRDASLCEDKHAYQQNTALPTSRPTCPTSFSFQKSPFRKEASTECVVSEDVVVGEVLPEKSVIYPLYLFSSLYKWIRRVTLAQCRTFWVKLMGGFVERNTWHNREQSHQDAEYLDDSAHQSRRGAITAHVLTNLGLKEETETSEKVRKLESIQNLIEALQCSDSSVRVASVHTLLEHREEISEKIRLYLQVEFAKMALLERNWQHRIVAIRAIGMWGGNRSISTLKICLQHSYEYVRAAAAQAIADIGIRTNLGEQLSDTILTLLVASLDKHWIVRTAVIRAIGTLGQHNVGRLDFVNAIIFALDDEECTVRIAAVRALYDLKGKEALPRLELIAKGDFEYLVRDAAQDILQTANSMIDSVK